MGLTVNRQMAKKLTVNRQKRKITRQISQQPRSQGLFPEFRAGPHS